ncbi:ATP-dependent Clp protease ATP-binding subunit ClpX [Candidatus Rhabdochlamydia oedothoracis]|uniref:ATP-dependent Clp protease ATP-binding subunit ClpX n=1 Tax=Candidatus Rhabdochlamydia oedothoracis TaxID=2720720 RepID=A0ABX8V496_9BACT|nr:MULTISPECIES: ATP-dependent Clp protease ATP-binding subunit ClpX [Rhabdochlamydia]KAG6559258.1 ATP-dependent Clp protease ATP-binding subunit ClpX [Candidatus Rhabdochlamydia sp. W815]MCL6756080.1 ATP-dependent Clp protease ATP-binding subunit ClpX [Candidatus Rhabdochlamydia oedothoracis]QYF49327.1 ATP-dependent Clp protease ATP-binding subunit ClpX [Candidatus Rhabdochlamydia oedothoracis]
MTKKEKNGAHCSFCGRPEEAVEKLISGPESYICDKCVRLCIEIVDKKPIHHELKILKPKEIKASLDAYVIGQERAKKTISVAVYNHYKRIRSLQKESEIEYSKSNVLLLGPTGSGKTLIARTLANILDVPFAIADATTLTEAGYVGEDVENIILRLVQAADYDIARAEQGIIYVDEIDKVRKTTGNVSITRDVSGEGVQQALLKIVEGTIANVPPKGGRKHPNQEYIRVNTQNILFIVGGAFVHLEKIIAKRLGKSTIGFDVGEARVFDTNEINYLLSKVEPEDLIQFGMIPEFVGRFNSIANCNELTIQDLVDILIKPKNAIIKQYQYLFAEENVSLKFTDDGLRAMAEKAKKTGTGARALRMIVESLLLELMFDIPSDPTIKEIIVDEECITSQKKPKVIRLQTS